MTYTFRNSNSILLRSLLGGCALVTMLVTAASAAAATSSVQVQMGSNTPVGRILSLEVTVNSVQLVSNKGVTVSLVARSFTMEQSHLAASAEVIGHADIPTGTYTKALVTVANPHVVYMDNFGNVSEARWVGASLATVTLKQSITAAATPSVVRISLDIASLLKFDPVHQVMLRAQPTFTVAQSFPGRIGADAEVSAELEATVGRVLSVSAVSFTVTDAISGLTTTYMIDRNTAYNGVSLRTMLTLFVRIHSTTRTDGQLLAQEVSVSGSGGGSVVTGVVTNLTGTKVTAQQIYGAGASSAVLGTVATMALNPAASFQVDSKGMDLTGLNVSFSQNNLVAGQRIQYISRSRLQTSPIVGASLSQALTVRLQLQSISGTVTNVAVASDGATSFDIQLPANDGSALSNNTDMVHIVTQPLTKSPLTTFAEGMQVKVRGLLLFDSSSQGLQANSARRYITTPKDRSNYYMVARTIQRDASGRN